MLLTKVYIKVHISRLATAGIKIRQIPHFIFGTKSQLEIFIEILCQDTEGCCKM